MKTTTQLLLLGLLASTPPQLLALETLPQTVNLNAGGGDGLAWSDDAIFNQFDTKGGLYTLTKVTVVVSAIFEGDYSLQNTGPEVTGASWYTPRYQVSYDMPVSPLVVQDLPKLTDSQSGIALAVGEKKDWNPHSASTGDQTYNYTGDQTYFAAFLGSTTVGITVDSAKFDGDFGWAAESGKTMTFTQNNMDIRVSMSLTYTYVPEPQTYGLVAGLGLAGLAGWRRMRRG